MKKNLLLLFVLFGVSTVASAQFAGGSGTESDPYQVATAEQLQAVSNSPTSYFIQTADINLTDVTWTPISTFTGTYDGNNKTISNLDMEGGSNGLGLFVRVNTPGVIKNVIMRDCYIVAGDWSGILCSTNGNWETAGGTFINCTIYDSGIEGGDNVGAFAGSAGGSFEGCKAYNVTVNGTGVAGGISGDNENGGHYWNCVFYGTVEGGKQTGGICGFQNGNCTVANAFDCCTVYGAVSVTTDGGTVGGIIGAPNWNVTNSNISNCAVFADVTGPCSGGIGGNAVRGSITRCYVTGNVKGTQNYNNGYNDPWCGGICAVNFNGPITDCYFSGKTSNTGTDALKFGGISGRYWAGVSVTNCYYNSDGSDLACGDGQYWVGEGECTGLIPEDMKTLSNFKFSDMSKWQNEDGVTTPFFANQTVSVKFTECTTSCIAGTGESDLESVYLLGSRAGSIPQKVTISNGKWSVDLNAGEVTTDEWIYAIGIGKDKMPAAVEKIKVSASTGISTIDNETSAKVEAIYNASGQRMNNIKTDKLNIVKYDNGKVIKVMK